MIDKCGGVCESLAKPILSQRVSLVNIDHLLQMVLKPTDGCEDICGRWSMFVSET